MSSRCVSYSSSHFCQCLLSCLVHFTNKNFVYISRFFHVFHVSYPYHCLYLSHIVKFLSTEFSPILPYFISLGQILSSTFCSETLAVCFLPSEDFDTKFHTHKSWVYFSLYCQLILLYVMWVCILS